MSRKTPLTYAASIARLRTLVTKLESAQVDVDELESVVKESVELITSCRTRLYATQSSVDSLLANLREEATNAPAPTASAATSNDANRDDTDSDPFATL